MAPDWARVEELFHAALERAPAERDAFLDRACDGVSTGPAMPGARPPAR